MTKIKPTENTDMTKGMEETDCGTKPKGSSNKNIIKYISNFGTLAVTIVMAIIAVSSLYEVKEQRELTYRQFVMANRPNVNVGFEGSGLRFAENKIDIDWVIANQGGDVKDISYQCVLLHMRSESKTDYSIKEFYVRNMKQQILNRGMRHSMHNNIVNTKTIRQIHDILNADGRFNNIVFYVKVEFTIPAELTIEREEKRDSFFNIYAWDITERRFENVSISYFDKIVEKISKLEGQLIEDKG